MALGVQKYRALMNFLSNVLREDGGFEYKKAIVDSILILIREIPDAKESGLSHLCEFIEVWLVLAQNPELHVSALHDVVRACRLLCRGGSTCLLRAQDCEFTYLSTQILHLLGREGPRTKEPARYIRYIYNRIILENATVRAAAVASLARFGALVADLRPRILVLLSRALYDNDDEARRPALGCCLDVCLHVVCAGVITQHRRFAHSHHAHVQGS